MAASAPPGAREAMSFAMKRRPGIWPGASSSIGPARRIGVAYRIRELIDPEGWAGAVDGALPQERERRDQPRTVRQIAARGLIEEPVGSNDGDPPVTTPGVAQHHQVFSQAGPER
jgi:hypothetical protein